MLGVRDAVLMISSHPALPILPNVETGINKMLRELGQCQENTCIRAIKVILLFDAFTGCA